MQFEDDCDLCELCGQHFEVHSKDMNFDLFYQLEYYQDALLNKTITHSSYALPSQIQKNKTELLNPMITKTKTPLGPDEGLDFEYSNSLVPVKQSMRH